MVPPTVPGDSEKTPASNAAKTILFADDDGHVQKFVEARSTIAATISLSRAMEKMRCKRPVNSTEQLICSCRT